MSEEKKEGLTIGKPPSDADLNAALVQNLEDAPVIYIDGLAGLTVWNGAVRINCYQDRFTVTGSQEQSPLTRVVCARLVMSPNTLLAINQWLAPKAADIQTMMVKDTGKDQKNGER